MNLKEYFENHKGLGVLSTADNKGQVNSAIYARPHVISDTQIAFIMSHRLSLANVKENPHAVFLFKEDGENYHEYTGRRIYLKMQKAEEDPEKILEMSRCPKENYTPKDKSIVYFEVTHLQNLLSDQT